jgi:WS/DGAT/MGAT family acyltransferase
MFLRVENEDWPCHFAGLAVLDGASLVDASGRLRFGELAERLARRAAGVRQLRQRVYVPGVLGGRALWVVDQQLDLRRHVFNAEVAAPGGDIELLDTAARLYGTLLDRRRPLWELWFLTGLTEGRVGVLLKLHHSVADGLAAVALMASLFDEGGADVPPWEPERLPSSLSLLADTIATKARRMAAAVGTLAHPARLARAWAVGAGVVRRAMSSAAAPRLSLNRPVVAGRTIRFVRLDLGAVKDIAHRRGGTVNDVVLDVWSGGLRALLAGRGELRDHVEPVTTLPASLHGAHDPGAGGNDFGALAIPLPVWEPDADHRLEIIITRSRQAKAEQHPATVMGLLAAVAATPLGRYFAAHQRAVNVEVTNVIGPPVPVHLLGSPVLAIVPIVGPVGNMGPILTAFSYAGGLFLVVTAEAGAYPDLDLLIAGIEADANALLSIGVDMVVR